MTEEQKAEEWFKNKICKDCADEGFCDGDCLQSKYKKQGYLAGYHEGFKDCAKARLNVTTISDCPIKDEWHDLEKDPTDLPKDKHNVWCQYLDQYSVGWYDKDTGYWTIIYRGYYTRYIKAWCELPKREVE